MGKVWASFNLSRKSKHWQTFPVLQWFEMNHRHHCCYYHRQHHHCQHHCQHHHCQHYDDDYNSNNHNHSNLMMMRMTRLNGLILFKLNYSLTKYWRIFITQAVTDEKSCVLFSATLNLGKETFQVFVSVSGLVCLRCRMEYYNLF